MNKEKALKRIFEIFAEQEHHSHQYTRDAIAIVLEDFWQDAYNEGLEDGWG